MKSIVQIFLIVGLMPLFSGFARPNFLEEGSRQPLITATVSTALDCRDGKSCGSWLFSTKKRHSFKITLTGASITFYNSNFIYSISQTQSGPPIAPAFPCSQNVVEFASGQLLNNTTYWVTIIQPGSGGASGQVKFTTGTGAGTSCVKDRN